MVQWRSHPLWSVAKWELLEMVYIALMATYTIVIQPVFLSCCSGGNLWIVPFMIPCTYRNGSGSQFFQLMACLTYWAIGQGFPLGQDWYTVYYIGWVDFHEDSMAYSLELLPDNILAHLLSIWASVKPCGPFSSPLPHQVYTHAVLDPMSPSTCSVYAG